MRSMRRRRKLLTKFLSKTAEDTGCTYQQMASRSFASCKCVQRMWAFGAAMSSRSSSSLPEFLTAYIAAARGGVISATMHMPYREAELEPLLRFSDAKAVICGPAYGKYEGPEMMRRIAPQCPPYNTSLWWAGDNSTALSFEELVARQTRKSNHGSAAGKRAGVVVLHLWYVQQSKGCRRCRPLKR